MTEALLLSTALGGPGSGRVRYGAAMALYREGKLSAEQLEVYRIASAHDALDPASLLAERNLPPLKTHLPSTEALIRALTDEIDVYLSKLPGPGVAEVRQGMARFHNGRFAAPEAKSNTVTQRHLAAALSAAAPDEPALVALIFAAAPLLNWITYDLYDRKKIGDSFATSHAFCSVMGEAGAIRTDDFDLGLFLIAPHVLYRDHCHPAPELYAPLTGPHGWRFKPDAPLTIKQAHEPVWNEPNRPHLTKVGQTPFLSIYGWTRDNDKPAQVLPASDWATLEAMTL